MTAKDHANQESTKEMWQRFLKLYPEYQRLLDSHNKGDGMEFLQDFIERFSTYPPEKPVIFADLLELAEAIKKDGQSHD